MVYFGPMRKVSKMIGLGVIVAWALFPLPSVAVAQSDVQSADSSKTRTSDDYSVIQQDLQQSKLSDALKRIQMLEQENRFLAKRVELLERNVNDIKNDRY
jgi:hypothetical protein